MLPFLVTVGSAYNAAKMENLQGRLMKILRELEDEAATTTAAPEATTTGAPGEATTTAEPEATTTGGLNGGTTTGSPQVTTLGPCSPKGGPKGPGGKEGPKGPGGKGGPKGPPCKEGPKEGPGPKHGPGPKEDPGPKHGPKEGPKEGPGPKHGPGPKGDGALPLGPGPAASAVPYVVGDPITVEFEPVARSHNHYGCQPYQCEVYTTDFLSTVCVNNGYRTDMKYAIDGPWSCPGTLGLVDCYEVQEYNGWKGEWFCTEL